MNLPLTCKRTRAKWTLRRRRKRLIIKWRNASHQTLMRTPFIADWCLNSEDPILFALQACIFFETCIRCLHEWLEEQIARLKSQKKNQPFSIKHEPYNTGGSLFNFDKVGRLDELTHFGRIGYVSLLLITR